MVCSADGKRDLVFVAQGADEVFVVVGFFAACAMVVVSGG